MITTVESMEADRHVAGAIAKNLYLILKKMGSGKKREKAWHGLLKAKILLEQTTLTLTRSHLFILPKHSNM